MPAAIPAPREGWESVVCVATGPSFTLEQAQLVIDARRQGRCRVITINDAWRRVPNADVVYACDGTWWKVHHGAVRMGFAGEPWTQDHKASLDYGLRWVKPERGPGLCKTPGTVFVASNSGHQALGLAYLFGAKRIVLVGYDFQRTGGEAHYFGDHPSPLSRTHSYSSWLTDMRPLAAALAAEGIAVSNCTTSTAIDSIPRADLAETLATLQATA